VTRLSDLSRCFQGVMPSVIATCDLRGEPNVTYLSQVHYLDEQHVALSCQFFNKTRRNVAENPFASVVLYDPLTFEAWRLRLRFERAETSGALFDAMSLRIDMIASHTGMAGVFKLISADVYRVLALDPVEGFLTPPDPVIDALPPAPTSGGPLTELRGLQAVSARIARAADLEGLLGDALLTLDELLGFSHSMVLLAETCARGAGTRLIAIASRGYGSGGIGAEVRPGEGLIGTVAERRRMLRVGGVAEVLRYGRAVRAAAQKSGADAAPEIPLPGLPDAQAQLALPLVVGERLLGVLAFESRDPLGFDDWDEAFLQIVADQVAMGIERMGTLEEAPAVPRRAAAKSPARRDLPLRRFVLYENDDCIFVDGEYLVRNVPALILWKLLGQHRAEGRSEFTNRELRLDPALGLPALKDNLESRLILLRKRLAEKCPEVRLPSTGRGRFALELDCRLELETKPTA
jgi:adenylate cyclase